MRGGGPEATTETKGYKTLPDGGFEEVLTIEEFDKLHGNGRDAYSISDDGDTGKSVGKNVKQELIDWAEKDYAEIQRKKEDNKDNKNPWVLGGLVLVVGAVIGGIYLKKSLKQ